jgi:hypothetical protein
MLLEINKDGSTYNTSEEHLQLQLLARLHMTQAPLSITHKEIRLYIGLKPGLGLKAASSALQLLVPGS